MKKRMKKVILPAIAVRDLVAFPSTLMPLYVGREKSLRAVAAVNDKLKDNVVLMTQIDPRVDEPSSDQLYPLVTVGHLKQVIALPDGTNKIFVDCHYLAKVIELKDSEDGYIEAHCEVLPYSASSMEEAQAYFDMLASRWMETTEERDHNFVRDRIKSAKSLDDLIREVILNRRLPVKQIFEILAKPEDTERAISLMAMLEESAHAKEIRQVIDQKVKAQMERNQREYFLNEQLKAIRQELGHLDPEGEQAEEDDLPKRVRQAKLPEEVRKAAMTELSRLSQMPPMSSESGVVRSYLETIIGLPWEEKSKVQKDLVRAQEILDEDHYGLEKIKDRILEYLAVQTRTEKMKSPILCFVGAPGVGKTSLGRSIARATGREYVRMALGGVYDESEIRGHRRTYVGAMPGQILKCMSRAGVKNPLFLLDEIDKLSADRRGDPSSALLEVLDPEQNNTFRDNYLDLPFDLSDVLFVATSNSYNIPAPLLDRMEVISLAGYTEEEKLNIAQRHLIPKQMRANGVKEGEVEITPEAIMEIIRFYTREAGVRGLERTIGKILRKVVLQHEKEDSAKKRKSKKVAKLVVDKKNLKGFLGASKYTIGLAAAKPQVGIVNGLSWSTVGGDILKIEAQTFPGKGTVLRTGSLGDVMKESVEAARSVVRSRAESLGIDPESFYKTDLHVHFPEGATPKDGPSAGAATTTAIISAMTNTPVRSDIAMTGEIDLHGNVMQIGGLKEKILAAVRGGCKLVLIPKDNVNDLEDLPPGVQDKLEIRPIEMIDEVLDLVLVKDGKVAETKPKAKAKAKAASKKADKDEKAEKAEKAAKPAKAKKAKVDEAPKAEKPKKAAKTTAKKVTKKAAK